MSRWTNLAIIAGIPRRLEGSRWLIDNIGSLKLHSGAAILATFTTISFVFSPSTTGMPCISSVSRREYCRRFSIAVSDSRQRFSRSQTRRCRSSLSFCSFLFSALTSLIVLASSSNFEPRNSWLDLSS